MKLNEDKPYLEVCGDLEEHSFSIQDQGMIFDILRNKMYSNPILAICREISCNARDAHREVGTPEVPVHIYLPNNLEPYYKIKDFGPGISPDRMVNIFIKYTASTKRDSNLQTGGFGLGAKTPFSYSDSFSIVTNYNGIQYNYSCNIDETKVGKISLMSESPTDKPNGTTIIVPVLPKNFHEFETWTEKACRHWDVKPLIKGGSISWQTPTKILEGNNWAITSTNEYYVRECNAVVDGIEYPLDLSTLRSFADCTLIDGIKGKLTMYFNVGELSLSANREQVYLDEKTQKLISQRIKYVGQEIAKRAQDSINQCTNLWQANIYYRKDLRGIINDLKILGEIKWNDIVLTEKYLNTKCPVFTFIKGKHSRYKSNPDKISRGSGTHISFDETGELYINDLSLREPTARHVKKAFEANPKLKTIYLVCPNDTVTRDILNQEIHLDKMEPKLLSSITNASTRKTSTCSGPRLILFKFDARAGAFRQVSYASVKDDLNIKIMCRLNKIDYPKTVRVAVLEKNKELSNHALKALCEKYSQYSFYGVDEDAPEDRVEEEFSDYGDLATFIDEEVLEKSDIDFVKLKFATQHHNVDYLDRLLLDNTSDKDFVVKTSPFKRKIDCQRLIQKAYKQDHGMLSLYETVNGEITDSDLKKFIADNPQYDIEALSALVDSRYKLLEYLNSWNMKDAMSHVIKYVNLMDKELGV